MLETPALAASVRRKARGSASTAATTRLAASSAPGRRARRGARSELRVPKSGEYDDVSVNIAMIISGIDQQTKKFTEPPDQIKKEIVSIKTNKSIPEAQKRGPGAA